MSVNFPDSGSASARRWRFMSQGLGCESKEPEQNDFFALSLRSPSTVVADYVCRVGQRAYFEVELLSETLDLRIGLGTELLTSPVSETETLSLGSRFQSWGLSSERVFHGCCLHHAEYASSIWDMYGTPCDSIHQDSSPWDGSFSVGDCVGVVCDLREMKIFVSVNGFFHAGAPVPAVAPQCPRGHMLVYKAAEVLQEGSQWRCDRRSSKCRGGSKFDRWLCSACDFNLCHQCFASAEDSPTQFPESLSPQTAIDQLRGMGLIRDSSMLDLPALGSPTADTRLNVFAQTADIEMVKLFLAAGANPNIQNVNGDGALHHAAASSQPSVVKLLLDGKADPFLKNIQGKIPLHLARISRCVESTTLLQMVMEQRKQAQFVATDCESKVRTGRDRISPVFDIMLPDGCLGLCPAISGRGGTSVRFNFGSSPFIHSPPFEEIQSFNELPTCEHFFSDEVAMKGAAQNNHLSLRLASLRFRDDKEFMLDVVTKRGMALQFASSRLQADEEVVLAAIKQNGLAIQHAGAECKRNKGLLQEALRQNESALQIIGPEVLTEEEIAKFNQNIIDSKTAVLIKPETDKAVALQSDLCEISFEKGISSVQSLQCCPSGFKGYFEVQVCAVGGGVVIGVQDGSRSRKPVWRCDFRTNFVWKVDSRDYHPLLRWGKGDVIGVAVDLDLERVFLSVNGRLQFPGGQPLMKSLEQGHVCPVVTGCMGGKVCYNFGSSQFQYLPPCHEYLPFSAYGQFDNLLQDIQEDASNLRKLIMKDWTVLKRAPEHIRGGKDFMLEVVSKDGLALEAASKELQGDEDIVQAAVSQNPLAIRFAGPNLQRQYMSTAAEAVVKGLAEKREANLKDEHGCWSALQHAHEQFGSGHPRAKIAAWKLAQHFRSSEAVSEARNLAMTANTIPGFVFVDLDEILADIKQKVGHVELCMQARERIEKLWHLLVEHRATASVQPLCPPQLDLCANPNGIAESPMQLFLSKLGCDVSHLQWLQEHDFDAAKYLVLGFTQQDLQRHGFKVRSRTPLMPLGRTVLETEANYLEIVHQNVVDRMVGSDMLPCLQEMFGRHHTLAASHYCWEAIFRLTYLQTVFKAQAGKSLGNSALSAAERANIAQVIGFDAAQLECLGFFVEPDASQALQGCAKLADEVYRPRFPRNPRAEMALERGEGILELIWAERGCPDDDVVDAFTASTFLKSWLPSRDEDVASDDACLDRLQTSSLDKAEEQVGLHAEFAVRAFESRASQDVRSDTIPEALLGEISEPLSDASDDSMDQYFNENSADFDPQVKNWFLKESSEEEWRQLLLGCKQDVGERRETRHRQQTLEWNTPLACRTDWTGMEYLRIIWTGLQSVRGLELEEGDHDLACAGLTFHWPGCAGGVFQLDFDARYRLVERHLEARDDTATSIGFWQEIAGPDDRICAAALGGIQKVLDLIQSRHLHTEDVAFGFSCLRAWTDTEHTVEHDPVLVFYLPGVDLNESLLPRPYHNFNVGVTMAQGIVAAGAVDILITGMAKHQLNPSIVMESCLLLANLGCVEDFPAVTGIQAVLSAMDSHISNPAVQNAACKALYASVRPLHCCLFTRERTWGLGHDSGLVCSTWSRSADALDQCKTSVVVNVLRAMVSYPRAGGIQKNGTKVLEFLCVVPDTSQLKNQDAEILSTYGDGSERWKVAVEEKIASLMRPLLADEVEDGIGDADEHRQMLYEQQQTTYSRLIDAFFVLGQDTDALALASFGKARALEHILNQKVSADWLSQNKIRDTVDFPMAQVYSEMQSSVRLEGCMTVEYFCLADSRIAVWVLASDGRLLVSKVVETAGDVLSLSAMLEVCRTGMGVRDRNQVSRDCCSHLGTSEDIRVREQLAQRSHEDECMVDLYMAVKAGVVPDSELSHPEVQQAIAAISSDPLAMKHCSSAMAQFEKVQTWLKALLEEDACQEPKFTDAIENLLPHMRSWGQLRRLNDSILSTQYDIADSTVRAELLRRITTLLDENRILKMMYQLLMQPIEQFLRDCSEVLIVPHHSLFTVPWAALLDEQGLYLIQKFAVRIAPSLRVALAQAKAPCGTARARSFIVGNPVPNRCGPLPYAQREAEHVSAFLLQRQTGRVDIVIGKHATRQKVLSMLRGATWVHFACHAQLEDHALVLARENDAESELLSMADVQANVRLSAGSTVILSACNTGRGEITGEGVVGLSRGFVAVGASCVLVSLWSVADESTHFLMQHLYTFMESGMAVHQALRFAMLKLAGLVACARVQDESSASEPDLKAEPETPNITESGEEWRSWTNRQGKAEKGALEHLFNDGKEFKFCGRKLDVGNGLDDRGMIVAEACHALFGVRRYASGVWGHAGAATRRAGECSLERLDYAIRNLREAVDTRKKQRERRGAEAGHDFQLQAVEGALAVLEDELLQKRVARASRSISEMTLGHHDSDAVRGNKGAELTVSSLETKWHRPVHWAAFLAIGSRTWLPQQSEENDNEGQSNVHLAHEQPVRSKQRQILTVAQVCEKLEEMGLAQYIPSFKDNSIDGSMLEDLDELWEELLVEKKAHRLKIKKWLALAADFSMT